MGNFFSSQQQPSNSEDLNHLNAIHTRLQNLEEVDRNQDGLITKDEFLDWKTRQQEDLQIFRETIIKMKDQEYGEKLTELQKQVESPQGDQHQPGIRTETNSGIPSRYFTNLFYLFIN